MYNPDEFIFFVFSYNRYEFLRNLVISIKRFYPQNKTIIYDDGSDKADLLNYYNELAADINFDIIIADAKPNNEKHGGLYNLMNFALQKAWQENYSYAFFIQDDMQFITHINLSACSERTFKKWHNSVMISPLFLQKIYLPEIKKYITNNKQDYTFKGRGIADVGIIHLERAKKIGLNFTSKGEKYNGIKYYNFGHNLILYLNPCLAWVPWAFTYKNRNRIGYFIYKKNCLFVNPLGAKKKLSLQSNKEIPFLEDFTDLNIKWVPKPYLSTNLTFKNIIISYLKYLKYILLK